MNDTIEAKIASQINSYPIILFMKGTPTFPMCGFSSKVVQALRACGADFHSVNVLEDDDIRQGIKTFSDWPTIPQLYIAGEFIGGCDIVAALYQDGELARMIEEANPE